LADDPAALATACSHRDLIYFSGITLAILNAVGRKNLLEAIAEARERGTKIAFDPNYRARLWHSADDARATEKEPTPDGYEQKGLHFTWASVFDVLVSHLCVSGAGRGLAHI
jgi:sugar/nucleoside kinase (ribokinase family)